MPVDFLTVNYCHGIKSCYLVYLLCKVKPFFFVARELFLFQVFVFGKVGQIGKYFVFNFQHFFLVVNDFEEDMVWSFHKQASKEKWLTQFQGVL